MTKKTAFTVVVKYWPKKAFKTTFSATNVPLVAKLSREEYDLDAVIIWRQYTEGKQTYSQLAAYYHCSMKTIQRKIDSIQPVPNTTFPKTANVLMDT